MPNQEVRRQYYGNFLWKGSVQHVGVITTGAAITLIRVSSAAVGIENGQVVKISFLTEFTLENYDPTNKLKVNALIHVNDTLFNQSDADLKRQKWHASIEQNWPAEERLLPAEA